MGWFFGTFSIVNDYIYTIGDFKLSAFNISNLSQPNLEGTYHAGWNIETMFQADGYLYLGGTNGMFIISIKNPA